MKKVLDNGFCLWYSERVPLSFGDDAEIEPGNRSVPCKLNNANMNKHLGQFLIKLFFSQTEMFECENSQRIS